MENNEEKKLEEKLILYKNENEKFKLEIDQLRNETIAMKKSSTNNGVVKINNGDLNDTSEREKLINELQVNNNNLQIKIDGLMKKLDEINKSIDLLNNEKDSLLKSLIEKEGMFKIKKREKRSFRKR